MRYSDLHESAASASRLILRGGTQRYFTGVLLVDSIQANLDFLLGTQGGDGAWEPTWSWATLDEAAWGKAEQEWKGVLTLEALRNLGEWGRLTE
jgi:hypothetical protein